ncbi:MAG: hypothetical protein DRJ34_01905 [Thermoprotei archaeon]|nr:MAG: hypothetical protein DRJ34_01905 [Thermoprotei archaeon]RLE70634.1 MAG: hypothetical protein DRJ45_04890 [Thermoprotei archaeon]
MLNTVENLFQMLQYYLVLWDIDAILDKHHEQLYQLH